MSFRYTLLSICVLSLVAGCINSNRTQRTVHTIELRNEIKHDDFERYAAPGQLKITGQGFMRQRGGGVVTCAGSKVTLNPYPLWFEEVMRIRSRRDNWVITAGEDVPPELRAKVVEFQWAARRTSECDAEGNFKFSDVPQGRYKIETHVTWIVGNQRQGGPINRIIDVTENAEVLLHR